MKNHKTFHTNYFLKNGRFPLFVNRGEIYLLVSLLKAKIRELEKDGVIERVGEGMLVYSNEDSLMLSQILNAAEKLQQVFKCNGSEKCSWD